MWFYIFLYLFIYLFFYISFYFSIWYIYLLVIFLGKASIPLNEFTIVALVRAGESIGVYINGKLETSINTEVLFLFLFSLLIVFSFYFFAFLFNVLFVDNRSDKYLCISSGLKTYKKWSLCVWFFSWRNTKCKIMV